MSRVLPILFNTDMVRAILDGRKTVTRRVIKPQPKMRLCYAFAGYNHGKWVYPGIDAWEYWGEEFRRPDNIEDDELGRMWTPPCHTDDILYVRETWTNDKLIFGKHVVSNYHYKADADGNMKVLDNVGREVDFKWKPSIHMPKEAARIWLKVTDVRVERLQEITEDQAIKEGISRLYDDLPDDEYEDWAKRTGIYPKQKIEWGYKNYLWHGNFGNCGTGNWKSDRWDYQYSSYENAVGSFSSLWNSTIKKSDLDRYGWAASPWVWVIEFSRCEKPKGELCEEN